MVLCPQIELTAERKATGDPKMGRGGPPRKPQLGGGPIALAMGEPEEVPGSGVKGRPPKPSKAIPRDPNYQ